MEQEFIMRAVCYDSVQLQNKLNYPFFADEDDVKEERINEVNEAELSHWIFENSLASPEYLIFEELGIKKNLRKYFQVRKPVIKDNSQPGDIDILLVDPKNTKESIAFQVKRVKGFIDESNRASLYTKNLQKLIIQGSQQFLKYRFHQNYVLILVPTDASNRTSNQQIFRYNKVHEKKTIYQFSGFADLPEQVGIFIYEINQPSLNSINKTGVLATKGIRLAGPIEQLNDTTDRINKFMDLMK